MRTAASTPFFRFRYYRIIGRFHALRRLIAAVRGLEDRWTGHAALRHPTGTTAAWLAELRTKGFCTGPQLEPDTVAAICRFAQERPCRQDENGERFLIGDVRDGRTPRGAPVAVTDVADPLACPDVMKVATDSMLMETVTHFLGYRPRRTLVRLFWSPVSALGDDVRRGNAQTIDFHYDIEACNSLYVYFYIVGGGATSGAHVAVAGSQGPKPLRMIANSCFQPEEAVLGRYGRDKVTLIEGGPGFGFIEDPACFHKALVPTESPRLCLQLRYS